MSVQTLLVACVIAFAFTTESALGFGGTVITLALGSALMPVRPLLAALIPLNLALSTYFTARYHRDIDRAVLFKRVLPSMLVAMPAGMLVASRLPESSLKRVFGAFVVALAVIELARARLHTPPKPLSSFTAYGLLGGGGVVHGMFGVGGPLAVYVISRWIDDKARFRATLNALWLTLNVVFLVPYVRDGQVSAQSLTRSAILSPALLLGIVAGEAAHRHVPQALFRTGIYVMLVGAGSMLLLRG